LSPVTAFFVYSEKSALILVSPVARLARAVGGLALSEPAGVFPRHRPKIPV